MSQSQAIQNFNQLQGQLEELDFDTVKSYVREHLEEYNSPLLTLPLGNLVFRARQGDAEFSPYGATLAELQYPEPDKARMGRVNQDKQSVFYAALSKEPAVFELASSLKAGDTIVMGVWETLREIPVQHLGHTHAMLQRRYPHIAIEDESKTLWSALPLRARFTRKHLRPTDQKDLKTHDDGDIEALIHDAFTCCVGNDDSYKYNLSIALAQICHEKKLGTIRPCEGTIYPSAQAWPTGDNIAMLPKCVDHSLRFKAAYCMTIEKVEKEAITAQVSDRADQTDGNGVLIWQHATEHRNLQLQQSRFTTGE